MQLKTMKTVVSQDQDFYFLFHPHNIKKIKI